MTAEPLRLGVLISGRGSNLHALMDAFASADALARVACVIADKADAPGLDRPRREGVPVIVLRHADHPDRTAYDAALDRALREHDVELVCLAGFMRILGRELVDRWSGRMINIHPSLLPAFKGLDTHARALAAAVSDHGCSVHWVTAGVDEGPVIAQAHVPVLAGDTPDSLAARVLEQEHQLYPQAVRTIATAWRQKDHQPTMSAPAKK